MSPQDSREQHRSALAAAIQEKLNPVYEEAVFEKLLLRNASIYRPGILYMIALINNVKILYRAIVSLEILLILDRHFAKDLAHLILCADFRAFRPRR